MIIGRRDESVAGSAREETITYLEDNSWREEIGEFAEALIHGRRIRSGTSADALAAMETVYRIYNADTSWRDAHGIEPVG